MAASTVEQLVGHCGEHLLKLVSVTDGGDETTHAAGSIVGSEKFMSSIRLGIE